MMDFAQALRMAADAAEDYQHKARAQYQDSRESGIDSQSVVDALATLGATAAAGLMEVVDRTKRAGSQCNCRSSKCCSSKQCCKESSSCNCSNNAGSSHEDSHVDAEGRSALDIASEVERAAGRMGLVQEDELAALRKRVVELEQRLEGLGQSS